MPGDSISWVGIVLVADLGFVSESELVAASELVADSGWVVALGLGAV